MPKSDERYAKIRIEFNDRPDSILCSLASDDVLIDCGDFSDKRLEALLDETARKIQLGWKYLKDRKYPPAPAPAAVVETNPPQPYEAASPAMVAANSIPEEF